MSTAPQPPSQSVPPQPGQHPIAGQPVAQQAQPAPDERRRARKGTNEQAAAPAGTPVPPPKLRRRPLYIALGLLAVALGAILTAFLVSSLTSSSSVVAVSKDIRRGEVIEASDLMPAQVNDGSGLNPIPFADQDLVVGKRAAYDLPAGGIVPRNGYTAQTVPGPNNALVGLSFDAGHVPNSELLTGDRVTVVRAPNGEGTVAGAGGGSFTEVAGTVVATRRNADGTKILVDIEFTAADAKTVAKATGPGDLALVLNSRSQSDTKEAAGS